MIEIKFRAWTGTQMLYRTLFDRNWYATPKNDAGGCHCVRPAVPEDQVRLKVDQFTGLKDKNGVEIYAGDVIEGRNPNVRHIVTWIDDEAGFGCYQPPLQEYLKPSAGLKQSWITEFDKCVIGNVYENPELLEGDK